MNEIGFAGNVWNGLFAVAELLAIGSIIVAGTRIIAAVIRRWRDENISKRD